MSWLKLILSVAMIAFCIALAYFASGKYRLRKSFYAQFERFNETYLTELQYRRKALTEFLRNGSYSGAFSETLSRLANGHVVEIGYPFLTKEEQTDGKYYFSMLGRGDSVSQISFFSSQAKLLSEKKNACAKEAKERTELYLKLGLLSGLALVILVL